MKIIYNKLIPFKGFRAINLFGVVFARQEAGKLPASIIRHETIHTAQMQELWYVPFYLIYFIEWLVRLLQHGNAYQNISFESEAYAMQDNPEYLSSRRRWAMWR